jgi:peptide/nickel transport system substrate-binding protein
MIGLRSIRKRLRNTRFIVLGILIVPLLLVVPGVNAAEQHRWGGTLIVGLAGDPSVLNPDLALISTHAIEIANSIFDTLVARNRNWEIVPRLARWDVSSDAKIYTFHLDKRAKWHDGHALTSADVKWTFEAIIKFKGWGIDFLKDVDKLEAPDDYTVRVLLKKPNAGFLSGVAENGLSILPKHLYEGTDWDKNPYNLRPVGSGPFKFVRYVKGSHVELEANKEYFTGRPYIDRLVFKVVPDPAVAVRQIEGGELDLSTQYAPFGDVPRLRKSQRVRILDYTYPVIQWLGFRVDQPPFNDARLRQAVTYAVNRVELNDKCNNGVGIPSKHLYLEGHWATDPSVRLPDYAPDKARQALGLAGYTGAKKFQTTLLVYQGYGAPECAQVIRDQLRRVGIDVTLEALEWDTYVEKGFTRKEFALIYGSGFEGPDPVMLQSFVGTGGSQNPMNYSNPQVDSLFDKAQAVADEKQRVKFYSEIQTILSSDLPRIPLHDRKVVFPASPKFKDFWQESTPGAVMQAERSYERVWWVDGRLQP